MTSETVIVLYLIYRILSWILGGIIIWAGVKLFLKGFEASSGNLEFNAFGKSIKLSNAAPGIYLFLFGTLIIVFSLFKGVELKSSSKSTGKTAPTERFTIIDTVEFRENLNVDSVYKLANDNIKNHRFLNAFKYLCIIKGSLYNKDSTEIYLKKKIDSTIKVVEKQLNEITSKSQTVPLTTDETKSVTVNEETLDTLNQLP